MLIEHTSRSTEDKPEIYKCVGVLRRSTGCFNQQSLNMVSEPTMSHNPLEQPNGQLKSQPKKSTFNTNNSSSYVNAGKSKSMFCLGNSAKKCKLGKSRFWESFRSV